MSKKKVNKKFVAKEGILVFLGVVLIICGTCFVGKKITEKSNAEKLPKTQLAIKINSYIDFEDSNSKGLAQIENQEKNNYDVVVKIQLDDTKEIVYESKKLSPGSVIEEIKLDKKLSKGKHSATAYFYAYDENNEYMGKSGARISLNING